MEQKPQNLQLVGIAQIVSGVLNVLFMSWFVGMIAGGILGTIGSIIGSIILAVGCPCGLLTPFLGCCGFASFLLIPVGVAEIVSGIMIVTQDKPNPMLLKGAATAELVGLLGGGVIGAVVGGLSWYMVTQNAEVAGYLEATSDV